MATRIYLPSTGSAAVSPAYDGGWTDTTQAAARRKCATSKISSAMASVTVMDNDGNAGATTLWRQYVSDPIAAQSITGTIKGQIRASQDGNIDNVAVCVKVVSNDGNTVRGTLLSLGAFVTPNAFPTSLTNRKIADGDGVGTVAAQANDRIVIELGFRSSTGSFETSGAGSFGDDSGTDLAEDESTTSAHNPWIELSATLTFTYTEVCTSVVGDAVVGSPSVKVAVLSVMGEGFCGFIGAKVNLFTVMGSSFVLEMPPPLIRPSYDPTAIVNVPVGINVATPVMVVRPTTPASLGDQTRLTQEDSGTINGPGSGDIFLFGTVFTGTSGSGGIAGVKLFAYVSTTDTVPPGIYVQCTVPLFILKLSGGSRQTYGLVSGSTPSNMAQDNLPLWVGDLITSKPGGGAWTWADLANLVEMGVTAHYTMGVGDFTELRLDEVYMEVHTAIGANVEPIRIRGRCGNLRRMLRVTGDVEG